MEYTKKVIWTFDSFGPYKCFLNRLFCCTLGSELLLVLKGYTNSTISCKVRYPCRIRCFRSRYKFLDTQYTSRPTQTSLKDFPWHHILQPSFTVSTNSNNKTIFLLSPFCIKIILECFFMSSSNPLPPFFVWHSIDW